MATAIAFVKVCGGTSRLARAGLRYREKELMALTWFRDLNPIVQALMGTLFTWLVTALGAGLVFVF